jgi:predicted negative regulator of RcsB-dependent stress response
MSIKEELKQDEELLVKVFQLEKFLKKYKKPLIAVLSIAAAVLIGLSVYNYYKTQQAIKANNALSELMQNPDNKEALEIVKKDQRLYDLYLLQKGEAEKIKSKSLEEIKAYEEAMKKGTIEALEGYLNNPNYKILKNPVRVALIRLYLEKGDRQKALNLANQINVTSKYKEIATYLIHYGIVK